MNERENNCSEFFMVQITIEGEKERESERREWQRIVVLSERGFPHYDIINI